MSGIAGMLGELSGRGWIGLAVFLTVLASLPLWAGSYVLTVATLVLYLALLGQSWNLMLGFAGLLSIGHALFVGLGSYTSGYLFVEFGLPPAVGIVPAVAVAVLAGTLIGSLGFRFSIYGVYFALLTIAFAEFTRIMFDHMDFLGATEGLFLPVTESDRHGVDLITLRGHPIMF